MKIPETLSVNGYEYSVIQLLGKGKGGYSFLVRDRESLFVLKQIHHESCDYYSFGDKMQAELNDYARLEKVGIKMPLLVEADVKNERILKKYIDGETIFDLVKTDKMRAEYIEAAREMSTKLRDAGLNIDWFPTNFIVAGGAIYYIDYECNEYSDEWNFENWGVKYWSKTKEFAEYANAH